MQKLASDLQIHMEIEKTQNSKKTNQPTRQNDLEKQEKCWKTPISLFQTYQNYSKKGNRDRYVDELKRNTHIYGQLIFNKVPRKFSEERKIFLKNGAMTTGYPCFKKVEPIPLNILKKDNRPKCTKWK